MGARLKLEKVIRMSATFFVVFLLSFIISTSLFPTSNSSALTCENGTISGGSASDICSTSTADVNVDITGAWTVSVSSAGTLGLNLTPTSSGVLSTATDNVNVYTNTPNGYQLYLNSTSGNTDIYNEDVLDSNGNLDVNLPAGTNTNHFVATSGTKSSPATLTNNTWGYTLTNLGDNPSQSTLNSTAFSKVELNSSTADSLISSGSKTTGAGDNLPVTYGFMADTKLTPGTYSTQVTYTAIAETPSYTISSVSPSELYTNDQTDKTITILTTTPVSELGLGDITAKIGTIDLTNCTEITQEVSGVSYRGAQCSYSGSLARGYYNVILTSSWHSATYTLTNGFRIRDYRTMANITYMQDINSDICENTTEGAIARLKDVRGMGNGGSDTSSTYGVIKAKDGNCWMTDNLNLYNKTISYVNTDLPSGISVTLPNSVDMPVDTISDMKVYKTISDSYSNYTYYNWCAAVGLTSTCNTTIEPNQSICPKNWQLPVAGNVDTNKSYAKYFSMYNITIGSDVIANTELGFVDYYGWFAIGSGFVAGGVNGVMWLSTPDSTYSDRAYRMFYDNPSSSAGHVVPANSGIRKSGGFNIRCVAR